MIITIDGPVASGKSSIAKQLAKQIGFIYFDTGAMYRCLTYALQQLNVDPSSPDKVIAFLPKFDFDIKIKHFQKRYIVNGEDVTEKIRTEKVTAMVSTVASIKEVREHLVQIQRELAQGVNAVFEGRDMGSIVFPNAELKIFLTADPKIRAERRLKEFKKRFPNEMDQRTLDEVLNAINQRDTTDSEREISPLIKAEGAFEIDTTKLSIEEIVFQILELKDNIKTNHFS